MITENQNQYEAEYERRLKERKIIKEETRVTIIISLALLASTVIMGILANYIKLDFDIQRKTLESITDILNIVVVMVMVIILAVRKTIYFSPRIMDKNFTLVQVLRKWRTIDIILLAFADIIPVMGLIISFMGMPFNRTFHFFVASGLLIVILMPISLKVRSKIAVLRKNTDWE